MFSVLIRQELLGHLMSARFFAAVVIAVLQVVATTAVLIGVHEERLSDYNRRVSLHREAVAAIETYSFFETSVERAPTPLSLFSSGLDARYGSTLDILFEVVPTLSDPKEPIGLNNPYLNLFSRIDLVFIFQVVLSLIALLFAYDAIAGDVESGVLRLVVSHPVQRGQLLFAKYLAAMVCLLLPLFMSLLLVILQCHLAPSIHLRAADLVRMSGIFLTTGVYLSVFYLMGLLISTTTHRPGTSLIFCLFLWVVLVVVYPNWIRFTVNPVGDTRAERISADRQITHILEETQRAEAQFLANSPLEGKPPIFHGIFGVVRAGSGSIGASHMSFYQIKGEVKHAADPLVPHFLSFHEFSAKLRLRNAEKIGLIRQNLAVETLLRQARWDERLMKFSPVSLYRFATAAWAGTDLDTMVAYIRAAQAHRRTLLDYFENKGVFGSLQWAATNQGSIDLAGLPVFRFDRADVGIAAQQALPELCFLFLINVILFMTTVLIFLKRDI